MPRLRSPLGRIPLREVRLDIGYEERDACNFPDGARPIPECMEPPIPCLGENV